MRILVTGAKGQLGFDLVKTLSTKYLVLGCGWGMLDISNEDQCIKVVNDYNPDVVMHCAAYTAVDQAEIDIDQAYKINTVGTRNMVIASESVRAKFCYISTDYVFDGKSTEAYREYDNTNPINIYGKSKEAGEQLVQSLSSSYFIVRTSWLFGIHGKNFVKTILHLGSEKSEISVVNDQRGSPTYTVDLSNFLLELIDTYKYGIYHVSNSGECSWYEFAQAIFEEARVLGYSYNIKINPCKTKEITQLAPRPRNSVMDHQSIRINGLKDLRSWREGLREFLKEYLIY